MSPSTPSTGPRAGGGLSIGEIARLAGVTPRAVRHYHASGILPEPRRNPSGYRMYDDTDLVALVRIVRLRAFGLSIPQIAVQLSGSPHEPLHAQLAGLVIDLDVEIERLGELRDRLAAAASASGPREPAPVLAAFLRDHGRLDRGDELDEAEAAAADLVDALHPGGIAEALDDSGGAMADPSTRGRLDALLRRVQALDPGSSDAEVDALAADVAATVPRPQHPPTPVDVDVMGKLLGHRLNDGQRRFMVRLRRAFEANSR